MHTEDVISGDRPYQCTLCDQTFSQSGNMRRHMRIHTGERRFECTVCCKTFTTSSNLYKHQRIHTGEKPYRCSHCDKEFSQSSTLKGHMRIHTGEKPFKCSYCEKAFSLKFYLDSHLNTHTKEYDCDKSNTFKGHMRIHTREKPFKCSYCEKAFSLKFYLDSHLNKHTKEYESTDNIDKFKESKLDKDLDEEYKEHSNVQTPRKEALVRLPTRSGNVYETGVNDIYASTDLTHKFECSKCEYKSATKFLLMRHMRKHTGEKPFACPECDYKSAYDSNMSSHIKNKHKWLTKHKGKKVRLKRKHTGEKTFSCPECPYRNSYKSNLNSHIKGQHQWTIEHNVKNTIKCEPKKYPLRNNYLCIECNREFDSMDAFENHILSHTENLSADSVQTIKLYDKLNSENGPEKEENSVENADLEDDLFECSMCDYTSSSENDIQEHSLICDSNIDIHN